MLPTGQAVAGKASEEISVSLYTVTAASGNLAEDASADQENVACTWNYTIDPRGNSLEFNPSSDLTLDPVNSAGTYIEYVLQIQSAPAPFAGVERTRTSTAIDVEYPDPTPLDYTDAMKWYTYDVYTGKF
jgi:hypothetical protein